MSLLDYAADAFGLDPCAANPPPEPVRLPLPRAGQSLAVIGPSGAGKTLALRGLMLEHNAAPLPEPRGEQTVLELFDPRLPPDGVLRGLARVGLADARLWATNAGRLSAGEYRRLQVALALSRDCRLVVLDEFDAHLDAVTARVIACNLRRVVEREGLRLVVSTHRPETLGDLQPACVVRIDHGQGCEVAPPPPRAFIEEVTFTRGAVRDYARFARWHYLGPGRPGPCSDVFLARHEGRAIGIAMFGHPHLLLAVRNVALPEYAPRRIRKGGAGGLNANVRLLQRVVVEPRFRGIGVATLLIRHGLGRIAAPVVECIAQMGAFSDFLLSSGFERVGDIRAPNSVRGLRAFLRRHGIGAGELLDENQRGRLAPEVAAGLERHIRNVVRTRIQTGFGCRRGKSSLPDSAVRKALMRVGAKPGYFLWRRAP